MKDNLKLKEIIQSNLSTTSVDIDFVFISNLREYYKSDFFKNAFKLNKKKTHCTILYPFRYSALHSNKYNLIMFFLTNCRKNRVIPLGETENTLFIMYHELMHHYQFKMKNKPLNSIYQLIYIMEDTIVKYNNRDYYLNHSNFFMEIEANVYASKKLMEYVRNTSNDEQILNTINKIYLTWYSRLVTYNFEEMFNKYLLCCKNNNISLKDSRLVSSALINKSGKLNPLDISLNNYPLNQLNKSAKQLLLKINRGKNV